MFRNTTSRREFLETIGGAGAVATGTLAALGGSKDYPRPRFGPGGSKDYLSPRPE